MTRINFDTRKICLPDPADCPSSPGSVLVYTTILTKYFIHLHRYAILCKLIHTDFSLISPPITGTHSSLWHTFALWWGWIRCFLIEHICTLFMISLAYRCTFVLQVTLNSYKFSSAANVGTSDTCEKIIALYLLVFEELDGLLSVVEYGTCCCSLFILVKKLFNDDARSANCSGFKLSTAFILSIKPGKGHRLIALKSFF